MDYNERNKKRKTEQKVSNLKFNIDKREKEWYNIIND